MKLDFTKSKGFPNIDGNILLTQFKLFLFYGIYTVLSEYGSLAIPSPPLHIVLHLGAISVVGNQVRAARQGTSDLSRSSKSLDTVGNGSGSGKTLEDLKVKGKTGNMRRSHRSSADGVGGAVRTNPSGKDTLARSEDIDTSTF